MADIAELTKKYWPYALGAVAGVGLLIYMGRSNSSSGGGDYAAYLQASAQQSAANQSYTLAKSAQDAQIALADKQANVAALQAQGQMVGAIATAAGGLVQSLNAPTVAALNAGAAENVSTIQGAVANSIASYTAQGSIIQSTANASGKYAEALGMQSQALSNAVSASMQSLAASTTAEANSRANTAKAWASAPASSGNANAYAQMLGSIVSLL